MSRLERRTNMPLGDTLVMVAVIFIAGFIVAANLAARKRATPARDDDAPRAAPMMKGMHCLICLDKGPDLTLDPPQSAPPGVRAEVLMEFGCGNCGRRWRWIATHTPDGISYRPLLTPEGQGKPS